MHTPSLASTNSLPHGCPASTLPSVSYILSPGFLHILLGRAGQHRRLIYSPALHSQPLTEHRPTSQMEGALVSALITDHYLLGSVSDFGPATSHLQVPFIRKAKQTSRVTHGPPLGRASFSASLSQFVSDLLIQKQ